MPDAFDVRPEQLQQGASGLRGDATQVDDARGQVSAAARSAAGAAGTGPLTATANDFASQIDRAIGAMLRSLEDTAHALDSAAANYESSDAATSRRLSGVPLPGFDGPR
ncbi:MAG TPA: type VII secretion target [Actinomycetospora sp.]|uniref:type VII secretion target n=1 Tax=Actinomycetospora sp. TaxID=1872135 RepID=UPI002F3F8BC9